MKGRMKMKKSELKKLVVNRMMKGYKVVDVWEDTDWDSETNWECKTVNAYVLENNHLMMYYKFKIVEEDGELNTRFMDCKYLNRF